MGGKAQGYDIMKPELFHLVKLVKKYHPDLKNKSHKVVSNVILWYALHGGLIHVTGEKGEALTLCRPISKLEDGYKASAMDPDGKILWVELWYHNDAKAAMDMFRIGVERWKDNKISLAYKRAGDRLDRIRTASGYIITRLWKNLLRSIK